MKVFVEREKLFLCKYKNSIFNNDFELVCLFVFSGSRDQFHHVHGVLPRLHVVNVYHHALEPRHLGHDTHGKYRMS